MTEKTITVAEETITVKGETIPLISSVTTILQVIRYRFKVQKVANKDLGLPLDCRFGPQPPRLGDKGWKPPEIFNPR